MLVIRSILWHESVTNRLIAKVDRALNQVLGTHVDLHLLIILHLWEDLSFAAVAIRFLKC